MVLYKLSFAFFPIQQVYARNKADIVGWLAQLNDTTLQGLEIMHEPGKNKLGGVEDIVEVKKGELRYDFGGRIAKSAAPVEIPVAADFVVKIPLESLPSFPSFQRNFVERKIGNLYGIHTCREIIITSSYVPQDIFEALRDLDLSSYDRKAEEHLKRINQSFARSTNVNYIAYPVPTKSKDFN
jgi:hypothetical protein